MNFINSQERKPISNMDILKTIKTRVVAYDDLKNFKKLDDIFINNSFVILIRSPTGKIGHWVCVVKRKNIVSYFDSYGRLPDPQMYLNGSYPYLTKLLYESPYELEYNEHDYQAQNTATCGRHVITRIIMKDESLDNYYKFMKSFKDDDELVTEITSMIKK